MIGERIKEARGRNGLTQTALAKKLGISRSAVNAWEMGISIPSAQYLIELSNQFNVSVDFLLERSSQEMVDITFLSEEEKHMIYVFLDYFKKYEEAMRVLKRREEETAMEIPLSEKKYVSESLFESAEDCIERIKPGEKRKTIQNIDLP